MSLQSVALGLALGDADHEVHEEGGNNAGPRVRRYLANCDPPINVAAPWCAAWVQERADFAASFTLDANPLNEVRQEALVASYWNWANDTKRIVKVRDAMRGDLVCFQFGGQRWDHIGFVIRRVSDLTLYTVEANTAPGVGSTKVERERDGDGVFTKMRSTTRQPVAVIRWAA